MKIIFLYSENKYDHHTSDFDWFVVTRFSSTQLFYVFCLGFVRTRMINHGRNIVLFPRKNAFIYNVVVSKNCKETSYSYIEILLLLCTNYKNYYFLKCTLHRREILFFTTPRRSKGHLIVFLQQLLSGWVVTPARVHYIYSNNN